MIGDLVWVANKIRECITNNIKEVGAYIYTIISARSSYDL